MERIAFHLTIQDGQREAYREEHEDVSEELVETYLSSEAGIERYSCFEKDGHVFGFMELEDPAVIERIMAESEAQAEDVKAILDSLGVTDETPQIEVWNKIDRLDAGAREAVLTRAARLDNVQALSAWTGEGMEALIEAITAGITEATHETRLSLGFDEGRKRAWLFEKGLVEEERQTEKGFDLTVRWSAKQQAQFEQL